MRIAILFLVFLSTHLAWPSEDCPDCPTLSQPITLLQEGNFWFGREERNWDHNKVCQPLNLPNVCAFAGSVCFDRTGNNQNYASCWFVDAKIRRKRLQSEELKNKILPFAKSAFLDLRDSSELQSLCCGRDRNCLQHLSKTDFKIIPSNKSDSMIHRYLHKAGHRIEVAAPLLLNLANEEGVERVISHELGHACQHSRHWKKELKSEEEAWETTLSDFKSVFGNNYADCVSEGIRKERLDNTRSGAWLKEAFAEAIAMRMWKSPAHWAWSCFSRVDEEHGPSHVQIKCALAYDRVVRANICGK